MLNSVQVKCVAYMINIFYMCLKLFLVNTKI